MSKSIVIAEPANIELGAAPIPPDWIISGTPVARIRILSTTHDWASKILVWDCTEGSFTWHYSQEETVFIVSGEAFMINERGEERRFGPGDLALFPAGTVCNWRVTSRIRKVAVVRESLWRPLGFALKVWMKILRTVGLAEAAPLVSGVPGGN